ncbi:MAG TPA: hypothetical protein VLR88_11440 [Propionibacteriaceae bacterium]|nr:hypothetical protein [Propionibacteriaceae bacterium]
MRKSGPAAAMAVSALSASLIVFGAPLAAAEAPPPTWDPAGIRTLTCDGEEVTAHWARGGVLTTFLVVGTTDVIIPKVVRVTFTPGTDSVTTRAVHGFDVNAVDAAHCSYTDPLGYFIEFWGVRT